MQAWRHAAARLVTSLNHSGVGHAAVASGELLLSPTTLRKRQTAVPRAGEIAPGQLLADRAVHSAWLILCGLFRARSPLNAFALLVYLVLQGSVSG